MVFIKRFTDVIEHYLNRKYKVTANTTSNLITFHRIVENINWRLYKNLNSLQDSLFQNERQVIKSHIIYNKLTLITYIGQWAIHVQQNEIALKDAKKSIGKLLRNEADILMPTINDIIHNRRYDYLNAKRCKQLLLACDVIAK